MNTVLWYALWHALWHHSGHRFVAPFCGTLYGTSRDTILQHDCEAQPQRSTTVKHRKQSAARL